MAFNGSEAGGDLTLKELSHDSRMRISGAKILKGCAKLFKILSKDKSSFCISSYLDHPGSFSTPIEL